MDNRDRMIGFSYNIVEMLEKANKKALQNLQDEGVFEKHIKEATKKIIDNDNLSVDWEKQVKELTEENTLLKIENKNLRLDLIDALNKSENIPCNCNPCIVSEYIKDNIIFKE